MFERQKTNIKTVHFCTVEIETVEILLQIICLLFCVFTYRGADHSPGIMAEDFQKIAKPPSMQMTHSM